MDEPWMGRLYQTANRMAHLYWLREIAGVRAFLAHVLFVNDPHHATSRPEGIDALGSADQELGLEGLKVPYAGHVLLEVEN